MLANSLKSVSSRIGLGVVALGVACAPAYAATATNTMGVSATVQATCLITTTPMSFGTYTGVVANSTATLSVTCTNTTPYDVALDPGTAAGATVTTRQMSGPNSTLLNYALFSDSARTVNWGQTVGTNTVHGVGSGSAQTVTVYGQVAANQYVAPGNYSDTITATINY
jgi:spore coat protein U-like protein